MLKSQCHEWNTDFLLSHVAVCCGSVGKGWGVWAVSLLLTVSQDPDWESLNFQDICLMEHTPLLGWGKRREDTENSHPSLYLGLEVFHITWLSWPLNQISHMCYSKCKWAGKLLSFLSFWRRTFLLCCPISWRVIVCSNLLWYFGVLVVTSLSDIIIWAFSLLSLRHLAKVYLFCLSFRKASS